MELGFQVFGLGGLGFGVSRVLGLGLRVRRLGFMCWDSACEFRVSGLGFR